MIVASLTAPLVKLATSLIGSLGLAGVAVLTASSGIIGVPGTEPTMLFAGFDVFQHHLTLVGIVLAGLFGDLAGASVAYLIGSRGRQELLERHGGKLHLSQARLATAHRWFERRGTPVIFVSRLIPFVRAAFPYAAGAADMPYGRFISVAAPGSLLWIGGLGLLGREVGSKWPTWRHHLEYVDYAAVALAVLLLVVWVLRRRGHAASAGPEGREGAPPYAPGPSGEQAEPLDVVRRG